MLQHIYDLIDLALSQWRNLQTNAVDLIWKPGGKAIRAP